ncbi:MarR family transcriptional regulator [Gilliamella sp. B2776]|uniref:MarR family winged helix-turn-helix transcriptional regulator n=1 Tax=unclassified Gilliamella TaxID=2685620 RepID=UPI00226ACBFE|nr:MULTISPECIES: MarR family transcriptional regulator [unclassified Gilliamella]MCX8649526.1 MarR family transcriptional regulator [Gilliamella sp. B2779]MCX8654570.1 MarR family transcriptional regulator [Gilliamella sp. B2737]MCX8656442.1 MarR family transcriptional regulator [Gilliamella sp. B2894]MCX8664960.1 MarR family transcriptional regulator [Gilliamella sp. B2887]MCX8692245.1 MarR family transcriptional regulator [Gilliamella sp. B2776]
MTKVNKLLTRFQKDSDSVGFLFMRAYSCWQTKIKNCLKKESITHPQFIVLATLAYLSEYENEITQILLAKKTNIDVMTISQILENLEKKSFIIRMTSAKDSRAKSIILTESGFEKINKTVPLVEEIDHQFFSVLGKDRLIFNEMLLTLLKNK